jgi:hypothetical protein
MKEFLSLLSVFVFLSNFGFGQSQRLVLIEEATNASCGPCAVYNPAFDALISQNRDKVTAIKYHWYFPGYDPMYNHNQSENLARVSYYGISGVPTAVIDGNSFQGSPSQVNQSKIDNAYAVPSPFNIYVHHQLSNNEDTIFTTTLIEATDDVSGSLYAHVAVIEKHIHFNSAPGSNGEKDFYDVMKKMLPGSNGTAIPNIMGPGDYVILEYSWPLANVYDINELGVVSFVQNNSGKNVKQAANSTTEAIIPLYETDVEIVSVSNLTSTNCSGVLTPHLKIRNNGSNELSSFQIDYSVNGGEPQTYFWSGNLSFLEKDFIELPEINFTVEENNELILIASNTNNTEDDYMPNNMLHFNFEQAPILSGEVNLILLLDDKPEETTWEVINSNGQVIQEGGPYSDPGGFVSVPIEIVSNDCFEFIIYDAGGDGICCENGTGQYALVYNGNEPVFEGGRFSDSERNGFSYDIVGMNEQPILNEVIVFPNPVSDILKVTLNLTEQSEITFEILNLVGKTIYSNNRGISKKGIVTFDLNIEHISSGSYILKIKADNAAQMEKLIVK